jgi:hypothetical protein
MATAFERRLARVETAFPERAPSIEIDPETAAAAYAAAIAEISELPWEEMDVGEAQRRYEAMLRQGRRR